MGRAASSSLTTRQCRLVPLLQEHRHTRDTAASSAAAKQAHSVSLP